MVERTVDLWEHLPSFLKKFRELDKLLEAEKPEFQLLVHNGLKLLNNLFILTADEDGLERFEKILKIYPSADDTVETRRKTVMVQWYTKDVYTLKTLRNRIEMLQGNDNVQIVWDDEDNFLLHITTRLDYKGQVDTLAWILECMLPAEVAYDSFNRIEFEDSVTLFYGVGLVGTGYFFLTNDFNETVSSVLPTYVGAGMVETGTVFGTNDFNETVDSNMVLYLASGIVGTGYLFLTDDLNENVEIRGNAFVGMANTTTEFITTH